MALFKKKPLNEEELDEMEVEDIEEDAKEEETKAAETKEGGKKFHFPKIKLTKKKMAILVVAAAVLFGLFHHFTKKDAKTDNAASLDYARTVILKKGNLDDTVSVSGTVASGTVTTVMSTVTTSKVISVNVKVGDTVKKGDTIAVLDSSSIDKQIADRRKAIDEANKTLRDAANSAKTNSDRAGDTRNDTVAQQDKAVADAQKDLNDAKATFNTANTERTNAVNDFNNANLQIAPIATELEAKKLALQQAYDAWQAAWEANKITPMTPPPADKAENDSDYIARKAELDLAQANYDAAVLNYQIDALQKAANSADAALTAARNALDLAQKSYDAAVAARNNAVKAADNAAADAKKAADSALDKVKQGTDSGDLQDLLKKKAECTLKAESDGQVTELNATVGSVPKDIIAKIQSTDQLIFKVTIPEADINRVKPGLEVKITADSIKTPAEGILTNISPTAETSGDASSGSAQSAAGYSAEVQIKNSEGLHIGTKAKGMIIVSSKKNVFYVPIDAIGTDESGKSYIRVKQSDGSFKNVTVETGASNDQNIEIEGSALQEGMEVLADADYEDIKNNISGGSNVF